MLSLAIKKVVLLPFLLFTRKMHWAVEKCIGQCQKIHWAAWAITLGSVGYTLGSVGQNVGQWVYIGQCWPNVGCERRTRLGNIGNQMQLNYLIR